MRACVCARACMCVLAYVCACDHLEGISVGVGARGDDIERM